jgi:hypothetical protein
MRLPHVKMDNAIRRIFMKKKNVSKAEKTFYIIAAAFVFIGLVLAVFGIIGDHLNLPSADNWILNVEEAIMTWTKIQFDLRVWGTIFLFVGVTIGLIDLLKYAKKDDLEAEKAIRRAQRLGQ